MDSTPFDLLHDYDKQVVRLLTKLPLVMPIGLAKPVDQFVAGKPARVSREENLEAFGKWVTQMIDHAVQKTSYNYLRHNPIIVDTENGRAFVCVVWRVYRLPDDRP